MEKDVVFIEEIDATYCTKYSRYPQYVAPMVTPEVRTTTLKIIPKT